MALVTQCHSGEQKLGYEGEALDVGIEMKDSRRNTIEFTLASARTQATQKSAARPKDQTESCDTRKSAARPPQSTGHAESDGTRSKRKKENTGNRFGFGLIG